MNRRTILSLGGGSALLGISGCITQPQGTDRDDNDDSENGDAENDSEEESIPMEYIRDAACTPPPAEETELEYTDAEYEDVGDVLTETEESDDELENFVAITTASEAESRLNPERNADVIWSFVDETNFEEQALLVWADSWSNTSESSEIIGVTQPDSITIHAYLCKYGSAGGTESTDYVFLIRVAAPQNLQQAKLILREATGHQRKGGITTREGTYGHVL